MSGPFKFTPDFTDALTYAAALHTGQHRKGEAHIPYVAHLLAVASLVIEHGGTEEEAIAALLHDSLEDQSDYVGGAQALRGRIERRFGPEVLAIVDGCTDAHTLPKPDWHVRKQEFIERLRVAPENVCMVVAADKLHNARSIVMDLRTLGERTWDKFTKPRADSLWYYETVADLLVERLTGRGAPLAHELRRTVRQLRQWVAEE